MECAFHTKTIIMQSGPEANPNVFIGSFLVGIFSQKRAFTVYFGRGRQPFQSKLWYLTDVDHLGFSLLFSRCKLNSRGKVSVVDTYPRTFKLPVMKKIRASLCLNCFRKIVSYCTHSNSSFCRRLFDFNRMPVTFKEYGPVLSAASSD